LSSADRISIERLATANDEAARAVQRLFPQLTGGELPEFDDIERVLEGGAFVLVARHDGEIVGMATMVVVDALSGKTAHVEDVVVETAYRGRGIGERLMNELMALARAQGADAIALTSNPSREAANRLYRRLGFGMGGTNYYELDL